MKPMKSLLNCFPLVKLLLSQRAPEDFSDHAFGQLRAELDL
jgi:hypothetical protein